MDQGDKNLTFGELLRFLRSQTRYRYTGKSLSQSQFGEIISQQTGFSISRNHVGNWENGKSTLHPQNDRFILMAIIRVLHDYHGIKNLDAAQSLLETGNYRPLNQDEAAQINPDWQIPNSSHELPQTWSEHDGSLAKLIESIKQTSTLTLQTEANNPVRVDISNLTQPTRLGVFPPVPPLIVGRSKDLAKIKEKLGLLHPDEKTHTFQILTAIRGWPGVGKTTLVSALAYDPEVSDAFPDGVLWVSLGQTPNLLSEIESWGQALGTEVFLRTRSLDEASTQLRAMLHNRKVLLLIDDVWDPEHAMPFNVGGNSCATIITTRLKSVAEALAPTPDNVYLLPVLTDDAAVELVRMLAPNVAQCYPDEIITLARELEGLPLALQVAGRLLHTEAGYGFGVSELITKIRSGAELVAAKAPLDRINVANETTPTIAALLQTSIERLDKFTRNLYAYLGVFAPKPATFDLKVLKSVWQIDDPKPYARNLVDRGLLEYIPDLNRYQMHAILVMYARTLLEEA